MPTYSPTYLHSYHYLPTNLPTHLPTYLHTFLYSYLPTDLYLPTIRIYLTHLPTHVSTHLPPNYPPIHLLMYIPTSLTKSKKEKVTNPLRYTIRTPSCYLKTAFLMELYWKPYTLEKFSQFKKCKGLKTLSSSGDTPCR